MSADTEVTAAPTDFLSRVTEYARLRRLQATRATEAEAIKDEADQLEAQLLEDFSANAMQNLNVGGTTVYIERKLWAKRPADVTTEEVCEGLVAAGHPEFVTTGYNSNTVSAYLRELEAAEESLPTPLVGLLETSEVFKLKTRKS